MTDREKINVASDKRAVLWCGRRLAAGRWFGGGKVSDSSAESLVGRRRLLRRGGALAVGAVAATAALPVERAAAQASLGFFAINPYRSFDSRNGPGPILAGQSGDLDLWTDQFGNAAIPSSIQVVTYNLTVVDTVGRNYLSVFPADIEFPGISSINWWASGITLANAATVAVGFSSASGAGSVTILCGGLGGRTNFIIDITGYYDTGSATATSEAAPSSKKDIVWRDAS